MSEKNIKRLMIFFIIFLPLQYAIVGIVGAMKSEPWPALVLPAFKSVFSDSSKIKVARAEFYIDDKKNKQLIEIKPSSLFAEVEQSQTQGFLRTHFADSSKVAAFSSETRRWLKSKIQKQYPMVDPGYLEVRWIEEAYNVSRSRTDTVPPAAKTISKIRILL